ncbi:MAG TPA: hypothetical protein DEA96_15640 [Leptospiraceae bacterium]|nr:hypothetical protein [Spirochaetaceae bacterium]HBS06400.1 hypothetical protein [Leptospiraceae bacterium]|tara:strand:+ start:12354 stop:12584 length:231 start_codon:yes stop_codon:yes gene_type:complete
MKIDRRYYAARCIELLLSRLNERDGTSWTTLFRAALDAKETAKNLALDEIRVPGAQRRKRAPIQLETELNPNTELM